MLVVSNTSPILNLSAIGRLELLKKQFGHVLIPEAVVEELRLEENLKGNADTRAAIEAGWLQVTPVAEDQTVRVLQQTLDWGESEAIVLAMEREANIILLDERDARQTAKDLSLKVTGVIGVILKAYANRDLDDPIHEIRQLQTEAGFYVSRRIMDDIEQALPGLRSD